MMVGSRRIWQYGSDPIWSAIAWRQCGPHTALGRVTGGTVRDENGVVLCIDGLADLTKDGGSTITGAQMGRGSTVKSLGHEIDSTVTRQKRHDSQFTIHVGFWRPIAKTETALRSSHDS